MEGRKKGKNYLSGRNDGKGSVKGEIMERGRRKERKGGKEG